MSQTVVYHELQQFLLRYNFDSPGISFTPDNYDRVMTEAVHSITEDDTFRWLRLWYIECHHF